VSSKKIEMREKIQSKLLTIKVKPDLLKTYTDVATSLNMKRGAMVKQAVAEFIEKQNTSQAA
jgi:predicted transcriptional regulator